MVLGTGMPMPRRHRGRVGKVGGKYVTVLSFFMTKFLGVVPRFSKFEDSIARFCLYVCELPAHIQSTK